MNEMFQSRPWPFQGNRFPADLGAVVMKTVLDDGLPVLQFVHSADNSWLVADGRNDPNVPGACVATHLQHVLKNDPSLGELASLPIGHQANRTSVGELWVVEPFSYEDGPASD
jgi:hypothetical protein